MPTNNYPGVGFVLNGRDFNFYQKSIVTTLTYGGGSQDGYQPDMVITFPTQTVIMLNETASTVVEYSFNGTTTHGELNASLPSQGLVFDNRSICKIWFRCKTGTNITVRVDAWGTR